MNGRLTRWFALVAIAAAVPVSALAQTPPSAPSAAPAPPPAAPPAASAAPAAPAASGAAAPAGSSSAAPADSGGGNVTGYAYGGKAAPAPAPGPTRHAPRMHHHANEVIATLPGFEMLADGGSRLFVQLTKPIEVDQAKSAAAPAKTARKGKRARAAAKGEAKLGVPAATSSIVVTLKGTEIVKRNNENALVTVHFNTPVLRARLVPAGRDLKFVIDLRSDVSPNVHVVPAKEGGAMLQIDFPAGSYLPSGPQPPPPEPGAEASDTTNAQ